MKDTLSIRDFDHDRSFLVKLFFDFLISEYCKKKCMCITNTDVIFNNSKKKSNDKYGIILNSLVFVVVILHIIKTKYFIGTTELPAFCDLHVSA